VLTGHEAAVRSLVLLDEFNMASTSDDQIWNVESGRLVRTLKVDSFNEDRVMAMSLFSDGVLACFPFTRIEKWNWQCVNFIIYINE
jgi:hypothetical protein